jgi:hypothetical protein
MDTKMNQTLDTSRSDRVHDEWSRKPKELKRACLTLQREFKVSAEVLFPLLCPTTEYDWIPGWSCELLHGDSGYAEYNFVIRTTFFGADEIWVCTRYEPNKAIEFARFSETYTGKVEISLVNRGSNATTGIWVITMSALNREGNQVVAALESAGEQMNGLIDVLEYYASTGKMAS